MKAAYMTKWPLRRFKLPLFDLISDIVGDSLTLFRPGLVEARSMFSDLDRVVLGPRGVRRFVIRADPIQWIREDFGDVDDGPALFGRGFTTVRKI